jgi:hypothetical protein
MFSALCDRIEINDVVITADALHAQHAHAEYLHQRGAGYLLIVKRNQPGLHAQLAALPWRDVPVAYTRRERGHGRTERRTLKITEVARAWPSPAPPRPSRSPAAAKSRASGPGKPATPSPP